jgi:ribosomal protein L37AE/L43A
VIGHWLDRLCPRCGSADTHRRTGVHFEHEWRCVACGYSWEPAWGLVREIPQDFEPAAGVPPKEDNIDGR